MTHGAPRVHDAARRPHSGCGDRPTPVPGPRPGPLRPTWPPTALLTPTSSRRRLGGSGRLRPLVRRGRYGRASTSSRTCPMASTGPSDIWARSAAGKSLTSAGRSAATNGCPAAGQPRPAELFHPSGAAHHRTRPQPHLLGRLHPALGVPRPSATPTCRRPRRDTSTRPSSSRSTLQVRRRRTRRPPTGPSLLTTGRGYERRTGGLQAARSVRDLPRRREHHPSQRLLPHLPVLRRGLKDTPRSTSASPTCQASVPRRTRSATATLDQTQ